VRGAGPLILPAALFLLPWSIVPWLSDPVAAFPVWIVLLVPSTAGWLLAIRRVSRPGPAGSLGLVVLVAAAARVLWLVPPVPLSDDLYRYLWDGRVANSGIQPFEWPPSAPELAPLRDEEVWPRINHPDVPTIYPPVAQGWFRALDAFAPSPLGARAAAALTDLLVVALLGVLLRARGRSPAGALVAGWCPLSVLESAGGGHVDAPGAMLLTAAIVVMERTRGAPAFGPGLLASLAAMVKPVPLLAAPALLRDGPPARRIAMLVGAGLALTVAIPYLGAGEKLFTGFRAYAEHWRFNDALYWLLTGGGLSPGGARLALATAVAALAFLAAWRVRDPVGAAGCAVVAGVALSPTVHPWYALWLVPFLPFLPRAVRSGALVLVALLPLSYAAAWTEATSGTWAEPGWLRPAVWVPVAVAWIAGAAGWRIAGDGTSPAGERDPRPEDDDGRADRSARP